MAWSEEPVRWTWEAPSRRSSALADALAAETANVVALVEPGIESAQVAAQDAELVVMIAPGEGSGGVTAEWIEAAIAVTSERLVPIEVWAVLPDGSSFGAEGRGYLDDARVIYRHVVIPPPLPADLTGTVRSVIARVRHGAHCVHTGPIVRRARFRLVTWRRARPRRHGPRVGALA